MTGINPDVDLLDIRLSLKEVAAILTMHALVKTFYSDLDNDAFHIAVETLHEKVQKALGGRDDEFPGVIE